MCHNPKGLNSVNFNKPPKDDAEKEELLSTIAAQQRELVKCICKVTCPICNRKVRIADHAIRCVYCGLFFCRQCMAVHVYKETINNDLLEALKAAAIVDNALEHWPAIAEFGQTDLRAKLLPLRELINDSFHEDWLKKTNKIIKEEDNELF